MTDERLQQQAENKYPIVLDSRLFDINEHERQAYIAGAQSREPEIKELKQLLKICFDDIDITTMEHRIEGDLRNQIKKALKKNND